MPEFYNIQRYVNVAASEIQKIYFIMGFDCINYFRVAQCFSGNKENAFVYVPRLALLQIGAALIMNSYNKKEFDVGATFDINAVQDVVPLPSMFNDYMANQINNLSIISRLALIREFYRWCKNNNDLFNKLLLSVIEPSEVIKFLLEY
jgi:hypothetical protein